MQIVGVLAAATLHKRKVVEHLHTLAAASHPEAQAAAKRAGIEEDVAKLFEATQRTMMHADDPLRNRVIIAHFAEGLAGQIATKVRARSNASAELSCMLGQHRLVYREAELDHPLCEAALQKQK